MKHATTVAVLVLMILSAAPARGQTSDDKATAEALFDDARKLMQSKNYPAACPKLEVSQQLDPGLGTLLNLASCYELSQRVASAWVTYREVQSWAHREGQKPREKYAREKVAALARLVPRIVITVTAPTPGLVITRDGQLINEVMMGTPIPLDPGYHVVEARAEGYQPLSIEVEAAEKTQHAVEIPALTARTVVTPTPTPIEPTPTPTPSEPTPTLVPSAQHVAGERVSRPRRTWAYIVGGIGVAPLGVGLAFGALARASWREAQDNCDENIVCNQKGYDAAKVANSRAFLSTILIGAGAAITVSGVVLWLTAPTVRESGSATASRVGLAPIGDFGLAWNGSF